MRTALLLLIVTLWPQAEPTGPLPATDGPLLIVAPHPDDETLGCGGLIAEATSRGRQVRVLVLTDGRALLVRHGITSDPTPQQVAEQRKEESRRAVAILSAGRATIRFLDFENERLLEQQPEATDRVAEVLGDVRPAAVYVTSPYEGHAEHVAANAIVRDACARSGACPRILEYVVSPARDVSVEQVPRTVHELDISAHLPAKREAVNQFRAHLERISPKQTAPLWADIERYVAPREVYLEKRGE